MDTNLLARFVTEARDLIRASSSGLMRIERDPHEIATINEVFRSIHTLKGSSGLFDALPLTKLVHAAEDLLEVARSGSLPLTSDLIDDLLASLDVASEWIDHLEAHQLLPDDAPSTSARLALQLRRAFDHLGAVEPTDETGTGPQDDLAWVFAALASDLEAAEPSQAPHMARIAVVYTPDIGAFYRGEDPLAMVLSTPGLLAMGCSPLSPWPAADQFDPYCCNLRFHLVSCAERKEIEHHYRYVMEQVVVASEVRPEESSAAAAPLAPDSAPSTAKDDARAPRPAADPRSASAVLKVDQAKVDLLMGLAGELVVSKNSLQFLATRADQVPGSRELAREIKDRYVVIDRLVRELQTAIMKIRMIPVSDLFDRFPRVVRDIARKLGKEIRVELDGETTEAEKTVIEALFDPLLHIIRNSVDHGIEDPETRARIGKPREATLKLSALQEGDEVWITVADDGRGIDAEKIRRVAVSRGLVDAEAAQRLSDHEAVNLIYHPGFSTAETVSDLSGRGVGMDVVLTTVRKLGGRVSVTTTVGEGTQIRLVLPLSMAVTRIMMVEAAGALYGIPIDQIVETVRIPHDRIASVSGLEMFALRDTTIPLKRLGTLLTGEPMHSATDKLAVMVCRIGGQLVGLAIDGFREQTEVILKPLDGMLAGMPLYLGTAILGDGKVLLVLDVKELIRW